MHLTTTSEGIKLKNILNWEEEEGEPLQEGLLEEEGWEQGEVQGLPEVPRGGGRMRRETDNQRGLKWKRMMENILYWNLD